jgi:hypothetical protein
VNETKQDFSKLGSIELARKVEMMASQLQVPGKEEIFELLRRFEGYRQVQTGRIPPGKSDELSQHELHVKQLNNAAHFCATMLHILDNRMLIDHTQPFEKIAEGVGKAFDLSTMRQVRLTKLIGEIYAAGGVQYSLLALPEELSEEVESLLKKRGLIK